MTDFMLLPPGTTVYPPDNHNEVVFQFPNGDDAIVFFEFIKDFVGGKLQLIVKDSDASSDDS